MQPICAELYTYVSYPNGKVESLSVEVSVPYIGMKVIVDKVQMKGNEIFMLCSIPKIYGGLCSFDLANAKVDVKLPEGVEDIKVHRYVLGKTWAWDGDGNKDLIFIKDISEFNSKF